MCPVGNSNSLSFQLPEYRNIKGGSADENKEIINKKKLSLFFFSEPFFWHSFDTVSLKAAFAS